VAKIEACKKLDGLTIPGFTFTNKISLVGDLAAWLKEHANPIESELQAKVMALGATKGVLVVAPGQQAVAATAAAAVGLSGMGGLGAMGDMSPLFAAMMLQSAALPTAGTAVALQQAAAPAAAPAVAQPAMQVPLAPNMLYGQYGLQPQLFGQYGMAQPSVQLVMPAVAPAAGQGQTGQKKVVRCFACQQEGHYANRCPNRSAASGANATAIVPRQ
jgi:hypothetical protein